MTYRIQGSNKMTYKVQGSNKMTLDHSLLPVPNSMDIPLSPPERRKVLGSLRPDEYHKRQRRFVYPNDKDTPPSPPWAQLQAAY